MATRLIVLPLGASLFLGAACRGGTYPSDNAREHVAKDSGPRLAEAVADAGTLSLAPTMRDASVSASDPEPTPMQLLYREAYLLRDRDPIHSAGLLNQVISQTSDHEALHYKANRLMPDVKATASAMVLGEAPTAHELFTYAYALKETDPEKAAFAFEHVVEMTPLKDPVHAQAKLWAEKLRETK